MTLNSKEGTTLKELDQNISDFDLDSCGSIDKSLFNDDKINAMLMESFYKTKSQVNNSFDSKDTVSVGGLENDDGDTRNIFGAGVDIDKIIQKNEH